MVRLIDIFHHISQKKDLNCNLYNNSYPSLFFFFWVKQWIWETTYISYQNTYNILHKFLNKFEDTSYFTTHWSDLLWTFSSHHFLHITIYHLLLLLLFFEFFLPLTDDHFNKLWNYVYSHYYCNFFIIINIDYCDWNNRYFCKANYYSSNSSWINIEIYNKKNCYSCIILSLKRFLWKRLDLKYFKKITNLVCDYLIKKMI